MTEEQVNELYKLARSYCIRKHIIFDDDIIQELVLYVYEKSNKYDDSRSKFSTFAYMCFNNYLCDKYRSNALEYYLSDDLEFVDTYIDSCNKMIIDEILETLKNDEIMMDWLYGFTMDEIATKHNKHRTSVSRYINKKIDELKSKYIGG